MTVHITTQGIITAAAVVAALITFAGYIFKARDWVKKQDGQDAQIFNQISIEVRYATAEDGFPTLTQTDINGSGSYYEAQLALLSLGTGGISR